MINLVILTVLFLCLSGLLALTEAALLSVSWPEVEEMVAEEKVGSHTLKSLKREITSAVAVLVILTNTVNVLGPIVVSFQSVKVYGSASIGIVIGVLTFSTIVFSEVIPKSLGHHYAPLISRTTAPAVHMLIRILYPLVLFLDQLSRLFKKGVRKVGTEQQIRSLAAIGRRAGHIERQEGKLIQRAFLLNDVRAENIMTPLSKVVMMNESSSVNEAAREVFQSEYSRYPVYRDSHDDIQGMVLSRDILEAVAEGKDDFPVSKIAHEILIVSGELPADELLSLFRNRRIHLAVVQEAGKTVGLVTLEDVLEELVGEIEDEKETPETAVARSKR